jgi:hypothetical protein
MPDTDRKKIKDQQKGVYTSTAGIATPFESVDELHRSEHRCGVPYAANNAAAWTGFPVVTVKRKRKLKSISIYATTAITGNATNYELFTFATRLANGDAGVTLGTWNTHTSAQSTITANVAQNVTVVTNTDAEIAAGSTILVSMAPQGTGWNVDQLTAFTVDLEAI